MKKFTQQKRNGDTAGFGDDAEFAVLTAQKVSTQYSIFVDNFLNSPQDFRFGLQALATAQESDEVLVFLSSGGGSVDAAQAFMNLLPQCEAPVTMIASGTVASAAALILSRAESYQIDPFCNVMYHPCTGGYGGTMDDISGYGEFQKKQTELLIDYCAIGILTEEQLRQIHVEKKTIWLDSAQFNEGFKRKMRCQDRLYAYVEAEGINPQAVTPAVYVDLMRLMLRELAEEEAQKPKPSRKPRTKKPPVVAA